MDELSAESDSNAPEANLGITLWVSASGVVDRRLNPATETGKAIDAGISTGESYTVTIDVGERWMIIGGHEDWLTCTVAPRGSAGDEFFDLEGSPDSGERMILLGGQWISWPRKFLVSRDLVERAARTFRTTGTLDQDLSWRQQVRDRLPGQ